MERTAGGSSKEGSDGEDRGRFLGYKGEVNTLTLTKPFPTNNINQVQTAKARS